MLIRWSGSPEPTPMRFVVDNKNIVIVDPFRLTLESRMDIPTGEAEVFDVAGRFDFENECYGWSNESYFSDPIWRNPAWRLPKGRYLAKVVVVTSGLKVTKVFRLINDVSQQDFRLEPARKIDKAWD